MDNDLNRSLRMLDNSLNPQHSFLLGVPTSSERPIRRPDSSLNIAPQQLFGENLTDDDVSTNRDFSFVHSKKQSANAPLSSTQFDNRSQTSMLASERQFSTLLEDSRSVIGSIVNVKQPWHSTANNLYTEFYEVLQNHTNEHDVFEVIADVARCCSDALSVIRGLKAKVSSSNHDAGDDAWLERERNTWRLLFVLYQDRIHAQHTSGSEDSHLFFGTSEKLCILNLFKTDHLLRECQLVIDWLEFSASENDNEVLHFTDSSHGWENTLHQLMSPDTIVFESTKEIIKSLHPDAPHFEKKSLHDLDVEDDQKLCCKVFQEIRCGKLEQAKKLCIACGHSWRAAQLEGWRLYHNPNLSYDRASSDAMDFDLSNENSKSMNEEDMQPIEGNVNRDTWKKIAFSYSQKSHLNLHERAYVAAYCGYLKALLGVCKNWEDSLWAYMRVLVDIRVESEIRDNIIKKYIPLPDEYWDQKMSINEVFHKLDTSENEVVRTQAKLPDYIIQKYIVLNQIPALMDSLNEWVDAQNVETQFLRFSAHLVLFLEQIGQSYRRDVYDKVLQLYINRLSEMSQTPLVAFYVSKLGSLQQIHIYAKYLEKITDNEERREALRFAEDCGINTLSVTKRIVENIRNLPHEVENSGNLQQKLTDTDLLKISALDWLLIYENQIIEAIQQTNALMFTFLTLQKLDAAQLTFNKIPPGAIEQTLVEVENVHSMDPSIKEYLCYKAYLDAQESFNAWYKQFNSKPIPPQKPSEDVPFTEKVVFEHREAHFKAETERWKLTMAHATKATKTLLYNVLLFPNGGWLGEAKDAEFLRQNCILEVVTLLYSVLHQSGNYEECIQLADLLADEKYKLYKMFSKEKLGDFLISLCETSMELLNQNKDPWGNAVNN